MADALYIDLPEFLVRANAEALVIPDTIARMAYVLGLVRTNIATGGGPFAAAVFERDSGRLLAAGANRVVEGRCSAAHAEVLALSLAQARLGNHDLGAAGLPSCQLVASAEPCMMCLGAVIWSGVRSLVCAARTEDVVAIGFDEGARTKGWIAELQTRGIAVTIDLLRDESQALLVEYRASGGTIYNARGADRR
jgi:tRNA(Arg) A34 adenosine deaminase TadA